VFQERLSGTTTTGVSSRKANSISCQDATDDEGVEHACAPSAVQAEQACRLRASMCPVYDQSLAWLDRATEWAALADDIARQRESGTEFAPLDPLVATRSVHLRETEEPEAEEC